MCLLPDVFREHLACLASRHPLGSRQSLLCSLAPCSAPASCKAWRCYKQV